MESKRSKTSVCPHEGAQTCLPHLLVHLQSAGGVEVMEPKHVKTQQQWGAKAWATLCVPQISPWTKIT
jgi:hypothetical protein